MKWLTTCGRPGRTGPIMPDGESGTCPSCGMELHRSAVKCPSCGGGPAASPSTAAPATIPYLAVDPENPASDAVVPGSAMAAANGSPPPRNRASAAPNGEDTRNEQSPQLVEDAPLTAPISSMSKPKAPSYFIRHWRGDLTLGVSFWRNGFLLWCILMVAQGFTQGRPTLRRFASARQRSCSSRAKNVPLGTRLPGWDFIARLFLG